MLGHYPQQDVISRDELNCVYPKSWCSNTSIPEPGVRYMVRKEVTDITLGIDVDLSN